MCVLEIVPIETIEAEHAQVDGQPAEVIVEQEARLGGAAGRRRPDLDPVPAPDALSQADGFPVGGHFADFDVGDA